MEYSRSPKKPGLYFNIECSHIEPLELKSKFFDEYWLKNYNVIVFEDLLNYEIKTKEKSNSDRLLML